MKTKTCTKCNTVKPFSNFYNDKSSLDGKCSSCKVCRNSYDKKYKKRRKSELSSYYREYRTKYYNQNKEDLKEAALQRYYDDKEKFFKYQRERSKKDPLYKLRKNLSTRLYHSLKGKSYKKSKSSIKYFGASITYIKEHLEKQFTEGMSWQNYGEWHIDHILPVASATNKKELEQLFHYSNLQPLWAKDNISKGAKLPEEYEEYVLQNKE